jgi:hypothetical protein
VEFPDTFEESEPVRCVDRIDNDLDGQLDCADAQCTNLSVCAWNRETRLEAFELSWASESPPLDPPSIPWLEATDSPFDPSPCPEGWIRSSNPDGGGQCEPFAELQPARCSASGQARFPGEASCRTLASSMPDPRVPRFPQVDSIFVAYVDAEARPDGNGTTALPYDSIQRALELIPRGGIVAVAPGLYREAITLSRAAEIVGLSAEDVIVDAGTSQHRLGGADTNDQLVLRGMQLSGDGVVISHEGRVELSGIVLHELGPTGFRLERGELVAEEIVASATGVYVAAEADASFERFVSFGAERSLVSEGALRLTDFRVADAQTVAIESLGPKTELARGLIDGFSAVAILVASDVSFVDGVVRQPNQVSSGDEGIIDVVSGRFDAARFVVHVGASSRPLIDSRGRTELLNARLRLDGPGSEGPAPTVVRLRADSSSDFRKVEIRGGGASGVRLEERSTWLATDVAIGATTAGLGIGIEGLVGAQSFISRCSIRGTTGCAISGAFARLDVADALLREAGCGLAIDSGPSPQSDVSCALDRLDLVVGGAGLALAGNTDASVRDVRIERSGTSLVAPMLSVSGGASATIQSASFEGDGPGGLVEGPSTRVATRRARFASGSPDGAGAAFLHLRSGEWTMDEVHVNAPDGSRAVEISDGGRLSADRLQIEVDAAGSGDGIIVAGGGQATLTDVSLRGLGRGLRVTGAASRLTGRRIVHSVGGRTNGPSVQGLRVEAGGRVEFDGFRVSAVSGAELTIVGDGSELEADVVRVEATLDDAAGQFEPAPETAALQVGPGAAAALRTFVFDRAATTGVLAAAGASLILEDGLIRGHPVQLDLPDDASRPEAVVRDVLIVPGPGGDRSSESASR